MQGKRIIPFAIEMPILSPKYSARLGAIILGRVKSVDYYFWFHIIIYSTNNN